MHDHTFLRGVLPRKAVLPSCLWSGTDPRQPCYTVRCQFASGRGSVEHRISKLPACPKLFVQRVKVGIQAAMKRGYVNQTLTPRKRKVQVVDVKMTMSKLSRCSRTSSNMTMWWHLIDARVLRRNASGHTARDEAQ